MRNSYSFLVILFVITILPLTSGLVGENTQLNPSLTNGITIDYHKFDYVKYNQSFNLTIYAYNISDGLEITNANCSIQLFNQTGNLILNGNLIYSVGYNIYIGSGNFSQVGVYSFNLYCRSGSIGGFASGEFGVTKNGEIWGDVGMVFIYILFIAAAIGNLSLLILTLVKLTTTKETIFGVLTTWGFYILMIVVNYMSGFMTSGYIGGISDFMLTILVWSNGVLPLISLVITMFIKGTQEKKPLSVEDLTGNAPIKR
jgi:hypothetical protein